MNKENELKKLREEMEEDIDAKLWFYPRAMGVDGYLGTGDVFFICKKPSTRGFSNNDPAVSLFYETLKDNGFAHAHVTDLIKEIGPADEPVTPEQLTRNRPYLKREMNIVQPELLVSVGDFVKNALLNWEEAMDWERTHIRHYTWGSYGNEDEFRRDVEQVTKLIE